MASLMNSADSSGEIVGTLLYILVGAIIGVLTSGIFMVVKATFKSLYSAAAHLANASNAAFDATYAENLGALVSTPMEDILIT